MTLSSWLEHVKPHRDLVTGTLIGALAATVMLAVLWHDPAGHQSRMERLGQHLALSLAMQSIEPMLAQDQIHLAVLANRTVNLEEVQSAGFYTVTRSVVASGGSEQGAVIFEHPIQIEDTLSGYVRVGLKPAVFELPIPPQTLIATLLVLLAIPVFTLGVRMLGERSSPAPRQSLKSLFARLPRIGPAPTAADPIPILDMAMPPSEPQPRYIVVANFYNQLGMRGEARRKVLEAALRYAKLVATLYQGSVRPLAGTGLILEFSASGDDRNFRVLCAAGLLDRLFSQQLPDAEFRFALHLTECRPEDRTPSSITADAALLAALAKPCELVITPAYWMSIDDQPRIVCERFEHPMLEDVAFLNDHAYAVLGFVPYVESLIDAQANALANYDTEVLDENSTDKASTF